MKTNKRIRKILSLALAATCAASLSIPSFAATQAATENTETTVPVTISAEATTFSVTVPTDFPTSVDPDTGETTNASDATITNNSSGSIRVSQIKVTNYGAWKLADFNADLRNAGVDSNRIGVAVQPVGGRQALAANAGTQLATTNDSETEQVLLNSSGATADEWVLDAANAGNTDQLTISYDTNATPVSASITNQRVASIVITVSWNK